MATKFLDRSLAEPSGCYLTTCEGTRLRLRPARPTDGALLAEFFGRLSAEDLRFRFLDSRKLPTPQDIAAMVEVDHRRTEHVLAFDSGTGELVGSLMLVADPTLAVAELAIAVASDWKARGVGSALLRYAHDLAFLRGVKTLRCIESRSDAAALAVERALGFHAREVRADPTLLLLEANVA